MTHSSRTKRPSRRHVGGHPQAESNSSGQRRNRWRTAVVLATHLTTPRLECTTTRFARELAEVGVPLHLLVINASARPVEEAYSGLLGALGRAEVASPEERMVVSPPPDWREAMFGGALAALETTRHMGRLMEAYKPFTPFGGREENSAKLTDDGIVGTNLWWRAVSFYFPAVHQVHWFEAHRGRLEANATVWFLEWDVAYAGHVGLLVYDHEIYMAGVDLLTTRTPWGVDFDDSDLPKNTTRWLFWGSASHMLPEEEQDYPLNGRRLPLTGEHAALVVAQRWSSRFAAHLADAYLRHGTLAFAEAFTATACARSPFSCTASNMLPYHVSIGFAEVGAQDGDYVRSATVCRREFKRRGLEALIDQIDCHSLQHAVKDPLYYPRAEGPCGEPWLGFNPHAVNMTTAAPDSWKLRRHARVAQSRDANEKFMAATRRRCDAHARTLQRPWC